MVKPVIQNSKRGCFHCRDLQASRVQWDEGQHILHGQIELTVYASHRDAAAETQDVAVFNKNWQALILSLSLIHIYKLEKKSII